MKFLLLGHFALDVVPAPDATVHESYGGIYHAVRTLASVANGRETIIPVFGVGRADHQPVVKALEALPGVETGGVFAFDGATPRVYHRMSGSRYEVDCSPGVAGPIPLEKVKRYLEVDGILINMVSGRDITLETMDEIRMAVRQDRVPVHFDFHNLTLAFAEGGKRRRAPLPLWRRWAFMMQTLQLNEEEIAGLTVEHLREEQAVGHILTLGVRGVVVTRGDRGSTLYTDVHKRTTRKDAAGEAVPGISPAIGAGDAFGAAFLYGAVKTGDLSGAIELANHAAAEFCRTQWGEVHPEGDRA